ncbi:hypothetical protein SAMN05880582_101105 [Rhizobium sp. RU20A]|uniref:hypothetical protein n=1 Tax=Rhizobium sp. RU20A TaxID=1907412 RepID=UPI0009563707|nr:hypothetical protein [Rhizobium sp. RU20A]SIP94238.1 hypothetical protein SAMN05880582_101105 [Rhizobium sp. RU20A]
MRRILTDFNIEALLRGQSLGAELTPSRPDHGRRIEIFSTRSGARVVSGESQLADPPRFSVVCREAHKAIVAAGQDSRFDCADFDVAYVATMDAVEAALREMADEIIDLVPMKPHRILLREESGQWRIEQDGLHIASQGSEGGARSFAYAAAQFEYEVNGIVSHVVVMREGIAYRQDWVPDHDFLEIVKD